MILAWSPYREIRESIIENCPKHGETNGLRFDRKQDLFASLTSETSKVGGCNTSRIATGWIQQVVTIFQTEYDGNMMPKRQLGDYAG